MRFILSLFLGLTIALCIFLGMHFMINTENKLLEKTKNTQRLVYLREKTDEKIERKKRVKPKKVIKKKPLEKIKIIKTIIKPKVNQKVALKPFKIKTKDINVSAVSSLSGAQIATVATIKPSFVDANSLEALKKVHPKYPRRAKRRKMEGHVRLTFSIDEKGSVTNIVVLSSSPSGVFDKSSINAIKKWKFKENYPQNATITFNFRLAK